MMERVRGVAPARCHAAKFNFTVPSGDGRLNQVTGSVGGIVKGSGERGWIGRGRLGGLVV